MSVATKGDNAKGIVLAADKEATVTSGSVATVSLVAVDIDVQATSGKATVTSGDVSTKGADAGGVDVIAPAAAVEVTSARLVKTEGARSKRILVTADMDATVKSGSVETSGDEAAGIAVASGGAVEVECLCLD